MTGPWCPWYKYRRFGKSPRKTSCHHSSFAKRWNLQQIPWAEKQRCWGNKMLLDLSKSRGCIFQGSAHFLHSSRRGSHDDVWDHSVDTRCREWVSVDIIWYRYNCFSWEINFMLATTTLSWRTGLSSSSWTRLETSGPRPGVSCWRGQRLWSGRDSKGMSKLPYIQLI